jgi:HTH-type transcriptional regulator/antitoxin HigA
LVKGFAAMMPRILKSTADHAAALAELDRLIALDPVVGSPDADKLELLADLIDRYEREAYPMEAPDPVEMIRFAMEQKGLKQKDLVPYIGSAPKVSEVLSGRRPLSLTMIRRLHRGLHLPVSVLIGSDSNPSVDPPDRTHDRRLQKHLKAGGHAGLVPR